MKRFFFAFLSPTLNARGHGADPCNKSGREEVNEDEMRMICSPLISYMEENPTSFRALTVILPFVFKDDNS